MKKILLCIDFSEYTDSVIRYGAQLAKAFNAELCLLHITRAQLDVGDVDSTSEKVRANVADHFKEEHEQLQALSSKVRDMGLSARALLVDGGPIATVIKNEANKIDADLILVGSQGHGRLAGIYLGSVSQKLMEELTVPVMVVGK